MADAPSPSLALSIVVPTHNRMALMQEMLHALERQAPGTPPFELVVVADGCVDGTIAMLSAYHGPFPVRIVERPGLGPAQARNAGADMAAAPLLLFLDDDVLPTPGVVAAHVAVHADQPETAVIGPYPPAPHASGDMFRLGIRDWWTRHFAALADPAHRFSFRDVLTGNLSMPRKLWQDIGGLDPQFSRAREDLELGVRLFARGIPIRYAPDALAWHHEHHTSSLATSFQRATEEGKSDVRMALKHPHLASQLYPVELARQSGLVRRLQLRSPIGALYKWCLTPGSAVLRKLDKFGLRRRHNSLHGFLHRHAYRQGVRMAAAGLWDQLACLPAPPPVEPLVIDLREGIEAAERKVSTNRPLAIRVVHGDKEIGVLPHTPGSESWDGRHLRRALATHLSHALLPLVESAEREMAGSPPPGWQCVGTRQFDHLLSEARQQWMRAGH
ncbi:Glycosyl transferase family 2 [Sphingobium yanoikuyae]|uniref:Glycosyl transferase family 2 n=1 Tax=Sphingobium yanoikuyae TaxID=13690 RepID=A0A084EBF4_SPHYA|nr:glycosyltransferase [Sphingobium yanoikuyae]KEZ15296.1 Glycosyl transferase family 2 [Sphingobium yanoikuyae]